MKKINMNINLNNNNYLILIKRHQSPLNITINYKNKLLKNHILN
jgi:hypothetical protein